MVLKNGAGTKLVKALEVAWHDVQRRHPELPDVVMITGSGKQPRGLRLGHYWHEQWHDGKKTRRSEVFISGEVIARGANQAFATMLHEAAHAIGYVRGVKQMSSDGRRHLQGYKHIAEELGLTVANSKSLGWSHTDFAEGTEEEYSTTIARLDRELELHLGGSPKANGDDGDSDDAEPKKKSRNYLKLGCQCGIVVRAGQAVADSGALHCNLCDSDFSEVAK